MGNQKHKSDKNESSQPAQQWEKSFVNGLTKLQVLARQELTREELLIWVAELSCYPVEGVLEAAGELFKASSFLPKLPDVQRKLAERYIRHFVRPPDCPQCAGEGMFMGDDNRMHRCPCAYPVMVDRKTTQIEVDGEGIDRLPRWEQKRIAERLLAQIDGARLLKHTEMP